MKKRYVVGIIIIVIILLVLFLYPRSHKDGLVLIGNNEIAFKINKTYNLNYDTTKTKKDDSLIYYKGNEKKQLTDLSEYNILKFYFENNLLSKEVVYDDYLKDLSLSSTILLIADEKESKQVEEIVNLTKETYSLSVTAIYYQNLNETTRQLLFDYLKLDINSNLNLLIQKDEKVVYQTSKAFTYDQLYNELKSNNLVAEPEKPTIIPEVDKPATKPQPEKPSNPTPSVPEPDIPDPEVSVAYFSKIGSAEFKTIAASLNKNIIIVGKKGCGICETAIPVLKKVADENKIKIYYLDLSESNNRYIPWDTLNNMPPSIGTPFTMIVQNNDIINSITQKYLENDYLTFFKANGINC